MSDSSIAIPEVITSAEAFDSPLFRAFRGGPFHRAADTAEYAAGKMVEEMKDKLIRSRQELLVSPSGTTRKLFWSSLLFHLEGDVFVVMHLKTNRYGAERESQDIYEVVVTARNPELAAHTLEKLRRAYSDAPQEDGPTFFLLTSTHGRLQRGELAPADQLDREQLALHYGDDMPDWVQEFAQGLSEPGLSILRGDPGTGKTSFLRHVMLTLQTTHRFYFVPVDSFDILSSSSLSEFWRKQQREHPNAKKVLVLEDAEILLQSRGSGKGSGISAILNVSDGLMKQVVQAHVLCTLNCSTDELDKAALRPGRLKFFRNFDRIPRARAKILAARHNLKLPDQQEYTLAEIFAGDEFMRHAGAVERKPRMGFGR